MTKEEYQIQIRILEHRIGSLEMYLNMYKLFGINSYVFANFNEHELLNEIKACYEVLEDLKEEAKAI